MEFKNKRILVLGAGRTGVGIAKVLKLEGADVVVNDGASSESLKNDLEKLSQLDIEAVVGGHPKSLLDPKPDFIVKNPGIPMDIPFLESARSKNIQVVSDVELISSFTDAPIIAVTGTNGKTTVTSLIGHILTGAQRQVSIGGNIGYSIADAVYESDSEFVVCEVSSFQLESTQRFAPKIAVVTNISPDHLDRHLNMNNYVESKLNVCINQNESDYVVLNKRDLYAKRFADATRGDVYWFSRFDEVRDGAYLQDGKIYFAEGGKSKVVMDLDSVQLKGEHNIDNVLASIVATRLAGMSLQQISKTIASFKGVEHRLEYVTEIDGVQFYNDSKATNSNSTIQAINAFDRPLILLLGGYDKGEKFDELATALHGGVREIITFGQCKDKLKETLSKKNKNITSISNIEEAIKIAIIKAQEGDVVLFSPACASWDTFKNFEQRGKKFKELVLSAQ
ncbi:UDP-N-acetylmuramoyl-L-alanine--D-glutamate ligase [Proteinivorax hydrogeniformans]|uniref:UDP-N-acetylmuramoylalanine--D-glutamate ligase n=1 Tax=Proteinivorax hydrogeniformans TaxID=1826727 RepID=A0AAU8HPQ0_9FIRM